MGHDARYKMFICDDSGAPVQEIHGVRSLDIDYAPDPALVEFLESFGPLDITIELRPIWKTYEIPWDAWFMLRAYQYVHDLVTDRAYLPLGA